MLHEILEAARPLQSELETHNNHNENEVKTKRPYKINSRTISLLFGGFNCNATLITLISPLCTHNMFLSLIICEQTEPAEGFLRMNNDKVMNLGH